MFCAFCTNSSKDDDMALKLGPFYGPFEDNLSYRKYYVHELCGLWSPNVFLDHNSKFKNIVKEIKRSNKLDCKYCGNKGGGLGCSLKKCLNNYHVLCAKVLNCDFNDQKYIILCPEHKNLDENVYEDNENQNRDMEATTAFDQIGACMECLSGLDEEVLLICDKCNKTIHTYCCIPKLDEIPEGEFICSRCKQTEDMQIDT